MKVVSWARERAFEAILAMASRPTRILRRVAHHGLRPMPAARDSTPDVVRAAAVQMRMELISKAEDYVDKVAGLAVRAAEKGARLIAFPEDSGTLLVGLIPGMDRMASGSLDDAVGRMTGPGVKVADVLRFISPAVRRIYETTFSALARSLEVFIVSGSAMLPDESGRMVNVGYLFGPDGSVVGRHVKAHLVPLEAEWGLATGSSVRCYDTSLGKICFPICMDATYFETFRIAASLGADIVVIPAANNEPYYLWRAMRGIWPRVQESAVYGLGAHMVGRFMGIEFTGRSGLFAPVELTPERNGVIAQADTTDSEEVVVGDFDLAALREFRRTRAPDYHPEVYARYLPHLYEVGRRLRREWLEVSKDAD